MYKFILGLGILGCMLQGAFGASQASDEQDPNKESTTTSAPQTSISPKDDFMVKPIVYMPEENPALRMLDPASKEECRRFETTLEKLYPFFPDITLEIEQVPIFSVFNPSDSNEFWVVGSYHDLPFHIFKKCLSPYIEKADLVFLESEFATLPKHFAKNTYSQQYDEKTIAVLKPLLDVFEISLSQLSERDVFCLLMVFDGMFGVDSGISMLAPKMDKAVFLLDREVNIFLTNLNLYKIQLSKLSSDDDIVSSYIDNETKVLHKEYVENSKSSSFSDSLSEYLEESKKLRSALSVDLPFNQGLSEEAERADVAQRNERWFSLLSKTDPNKKKFVCVGFGHLPDLFSLFKRHGFTIKPLV